jgi:negative regulator of flagellin synthesis FlgM
MRIDLSFPADTTIDGTAITKPGNSRTDAGQNGDVLGMDEVRLSSDQSAVDSVKTQLAQFPEIRADKVEALRKQISDGTYHVDAGRVAEALSRDLLGV